MWAKHQSQSSHTFTIERDLHVALYLTDLRLHGRYLQYVPWVFNSSTVGVLFLRRRCSIPLSCSEQYPFFEDTKEVCCDYPFSVMQYRVAAVVVRTQPASDTVLDVLMSRLQ